MHEVGTGRIARADGMTIADRLQAWLNDVARPGVGHHTFARYGSVLDSGTIRLRGSRSHLDSGPAGGSVERLPDGEVALRNHG